MPPLRHEGSNVRLTLEILHYIKESVVNIGLVVELNFDLIEVREGILQQKLVSMWPFTALIRHGQVRVRCSYGSYTT